MKNAGALLAGLFIFGWLFAIIGAIIGGVVAALNGAGAPTLWGWTMIGAWLVGSGITMALMSMSKGSGGSLDNRHEYGSTAWYHHENERQRYLDS